MALARWTGLVQDGAGNAVAGAQIEVRSEQTGRLVPLFADREGQTSLGNPFTAPEATVTFHAGGDAYRIIASKGGLLSEWRYVALGTSAEYDLDDLVVELQSGIYPAMTFAQLEAFDPGEGGAIAGVVYNDPNPLLNGYYRRGNEGWERGRGFPDTFARLENFGGTANAQTAFLAPGVDPANVQVLFAFASTENTGPMTPSGNGEAPREVVNLADNPLAAGEWTGAVIFAQDGERYRLLLDAEAALIATQQADRAAQEAGAAVASADRAQTEADRAQANADQTAANIGLRDFADVPTLLSNTSLQYGNGAGQVQAGDVLRTRKEGFAYEVLAADAPDADVHLEVGQGVKLSVRPNGLVRPAMFGVLDDGDPNENVNDTLQRVAAFCRAERFPAKFGPRQYLTGALEFNADVFGCGDATVLKSANLDRQWLVVISGPAFVANFHIDGVVSPDPESWNINNFNEFYGSRGICVNDTTDVHIENVHTRNTYQAGIAVQRSKRVSIDRCTTQRTRGNFGDGFFIATSQHVSVKNCYAYDFTRIGFVTDSFHSGPAEYAARVSFENCYAEYGHDASVLFSTTPVPGGGNEYNVGFWSETSGSVTWENCHTKNVRHDGWRIVSGANPDGSGQAQYHAKNCTVQEAAGGFQVYGLVGFPVKVVLESCHADVTGGDCFGGSGGKAGDVLHLIGCSSVLRGTTAARSSLKIGAGTVIVDGFTETWAVLNTTLRDAQDNYYGSVSHFNNAAKKAVIRDWKTFDAAGNQIGSVFKFLSPARASLELNLERCFVRGVATECRDYIAEDCTFEQTGYVRFNRRLHIKGGSILNGSTAFFYRDTSEEALLEGVFLNLAASGGYVGFFNDNSAQASIKARLKGCKIRKNFESGYALRINADAGVINAAGANHMVLDGCVIENTGGSTSNPIAQIDSSTGAASSVIGYGNLKSSSLGTIA